jgi:hypothetical protein
LHWICYQVDDAEAEEAAPPVIYEDMDSDEEEASDDAMDTEEGEPEEDIDAPTYSDGSEVMSD